MSSSTNGPADWFKWLIGTIIALLAAGGGIAALLNYRDSHHSPPAVSAPAETPAEKSIRLGREQGNTGGPSTHQ